MCGARLYIVVCENVQKSTMYTKNAYTTIDTLLNMDVENYLLGSNLLGIISQRLVKKLCPNCREKKLATTYEKTIIKHITGQDVKELFINKGCTECQSGYTEQMPVIEVIPITDELRSAISNNKDRKLIQKIIYKNNTSIIEDTFAKVINGETDRMTRLVKDLLTLSQLDSSKIIERRNETLKENFPLKEIYAVGDGVPSYLQELGEVDNIPDEYYNDALVIIVDTSVEKRICDDRWKTGKYIIKIDHHDDSPDFGDLIYVDNKCPACSSIIVSMIKAWGDEVKINKVLDQKYNPYLTSLIIFIPVFIFNTFTTILLFIYLTYI